MEKRYIIAALVAFILVFFSVPILSVIMTLEVVFAAITFVGAFGIMVAIAWVVFEYTMEKSKDFIKKVK